MIITTPEEWTQLYRSIREESSRSDEKHVFIYACSTDCDSVCALRILEVRPSWVLAIITQSGDGAVTCMPLH